MHRFTCSLVPFLTALVCAGVSLFPASAQSPTAIAVAREVVLLKADAVGLTKSLSPPAGGEVVRGALPVKH
jgi:hypothetical protein